MPTYPSAHEAKVVAQLNAVYGRPPTTLSPKRALAPASSSKGGRPSAPPNSGRGRRPASAGMMSQSLETAEVKVFVGIGTTRSCNHHRHWEGRCCQLVGEHSCFFFWQTSCRVVWCLVTLRRLGVQVQGVYLTTRRFCSLLQKTRTTPHLLNDSPQPSPADLQSWSEDQERRTVQPPRQPKPGTARSARRPLSASAVPQGGSLLRPQTASSYERASAQGTSTTDPYQHFDPSSFFTPAGGPLYNPDHERMRREANNDPKPQSSRRPIPPHSAPSQRRDLGEEPAVGSGGEQSRASEPLWNRTFMTRPQTAGSERRKKNPFHEKHLLPKPPVTVRPKTAAELLKAPLKLLCRDTGAGVPSSSRRNMRSRPASAGLVSEMGSSSSSSSADQSGRTLLVGLPTSGGVGVPGRGASRSFHASPGGEQQRPPSARAPRPPSTGRSATTPSSLRETSIKGLFVDASGNYVTGERAE